MKFSRFTIFSFRR